MKFIMTVILLYACLSINAQQSTTEMKKIIDAMQDMYHVNFVYDSSLANIKPKSAPLSGSSLVENLKLAYNGKFGMNMFYYSAKIVILFLDMYVRKMEKHSLM